MKDPAIKLFGKEILVIGSARDERVIRTGDEEQGQEEDELETDKDPRPDNYPIPMEEDETRSNFQDDPKTPPILEENGSETTQNTENDQNKTENSDQKTLKKPDKILPCPRCKSMDTKFCYYNNYNVNQPRHFCKACQRYWTAGGTMRNVAVGAGRRKSKNSFSHYRHITVSDPTVLSFESDAPKKNPIFVNNIFNGENENGSACSSGSFPITNSNSPKSPSNLNGFTNQVPCFPWPYPAMPNTGFCPPGYPIPVYPIPYWNCGAWPVPWIPNQNLPNPIVSSPLGKHSRNGKSINQINSENGDIEETKSSERVILVPKTLRIDDPDEASKSSIWATLGIKNDLINRKSLFKAFERKSDENKNYTPETNSLMGANPAALSRSLNFRETV